MTKGQHRPCFLRKFPHRAVGDEKWCSICVVCFCNIIGNVDGRETFECWKSLTQKQSTAFRKMLQGRENKLGSGRKNVSPGRFHHMLYFTKRLWCRWVYATSVYCWVISRPAEISTSKATFVIHRTEQLRQLCSQNKPYLWHLFRKEDLFRWSCQQFGTLVRAFHLLNFNSLLKSDCR